MLRPIERLIVRLTVLLMVLLTAAAVPAVSTAAECRLTDQAFSDQVDALTGWQSIRDHQKNHFPPCADDGAVAQTHSELVSRTLAARWAELAELHALVVAAPDFKSFVLRHVNARASKADLQTVLTYATIRCPRRQADFCREIRTAAAQGLEQLR